LSHSVRTFPLPYSWVSKGALEIRYLWELVNPFQYGDQNGYYGPWQFYHERILFFGKLPLFLVMTLVIWAVGKRVRRIEIWVLLSIAVFGLWMSFANFAFFDLYHLFWEYVPFYQKLRIPTRHVILFIFAVSALTGISVSFIKNFWLKIIVLCVSLIELVPFAQHFVSLAPVPGTGHDKQLVSYLQEEKGLFREVNNFNAGLPIRESLDFNAAVRYGYYSSTGYDTALLRNYYEFIDAAVGHTKPGITDNDIQVPYLDLHSSYVNFLNIKYIFTPLFMDTVGSGQDRRYVLLKEKSNEWNFYQNTAALPRYFVVGSTQLFDNRGQVASTIRNAVHDLSKIVLFESKNIPKGSTYPLSCGNTLYIPTIQVYQPNFIRMHLALPCNGFLASSEVMYPGWEAYLDGKKVEIIEGNLAFRTIYVPEGTHTIEYRFVPYSVYVGLAMSVATVALLFVWFRLPRSKWLNRSV